ncbi:MAG: NHLP leader peptide family RiPP precursor [Actinomycetes bacterium]
MTHGKEEVAALYGALARKAQSDPRFKERLLASPDEVLREEGWQIAEGMEIRVVQNSEKIRYLTLPAGPNLSEEELDAVAAAGSGVVSYVGQMISYVKP